MPPSPRSGVVSVDIPLQPDELIDAWRPESRRLLLTTKEPLRLQQRVVARITAVGLNVAATITGRVVSASRSGDHYRIELVPDDIRVRAMERLLSIARGEAVDDRTRAPRFLASMPAVVYLSAGPVYMTTFSVSENGCGIAWSGAVPAIGTPMDVRIGAGTQAASFRAVVCWTAKAGRTAMVGVRFVTGERNAWVTMLTDLKRSGAPLA
ncbi:MAG TPA: PilZ domain-containing protein [Anaeromyxobacter sp.]|nr:PilZ domain-containing protein [Anaeromyxobacter sp.]